MTDVDKGVVAKLKQKLEDARSSSLPDRDDLTNWLADIERMFCRVEHALSTQEELTDIQFERSEKSYYEELIDARYDAPSLRITFASTLVIVFEPIARLIAGARGRIDVFREGNRSNLFYLLRHENSWDAWHQPNALQRSSLGEVTDTLLLDIMADLL